MPNIKIICVDGGEEFIFTESEQEWYAQRNLVTPKRCPEHRKEKREYEEQRRSNG